MRVPNLKFWSFSLRGGVEAGRAHSCICVVVASISKGPAEPTSAKGW